MLFNAENDNHTTEPLILGRDAPVQSGYPPRDPCAALGIFLCMGLCIKKAPFRPFLI